MSEEEPDVERDYWDDYSPEEWNSGPWCKHWMDAEKCEECREEYDPWPELEEDFDNE